MFCKFCGSELRNEARFCKKCGKPVDTSETVSEAVAPVSEKNAADIQFNETARLAESGDMNAQFELGRIFAHKEEFTDAIIWFEKAAAQGHVLAISSLGIIYLDGYGVDKDINRALEYLEKASDMDDPYSTNLLGTIYYDGTGVKQDGEKAAMYFEKAAKLGDANAFLNLGDYYIKRAIDCYAVILSDCEDKEFVDSAYSNLLKYAESGVVDAQFALYKYYSTENLKSYSEETRKKSLKWLMKAAEGGIASAQYDLGMLFSTGVRSIPKDTEKAIEWLTKAREQGNEAADYAIRQIEKFDK